MKWPYALCLWSGYFGGTLTICAFAILYGRSQNAAEIVGNMMFACTMSLAVGFTMGQKLARRCPQITQLTAILSLASILALGPIVLDDIAAIASSAPAQDARLNFLLAAAFVIPPLTLLSTIAPYAAALVDRTRSHAGATSALAMLLSTIGFATGGLLNAHYVMNGLAVENILKITLACSAIMVLATMIRNPPRKIRGR